MINSVIVKKVTVGLYPFSDGLKTPPSITKGDILILGNNRNLKTGSQYELLIHQFTSNDIMEFSNFINMYKLKFQGWSIYTSIDTKDLTDFISRYNESPVVDPKIDSRLWSN